MWMKKQLMKRIGAGGDNDHQREAFEAYHNNAIIMPFMPSYSYRSLVKCIEQLLVRLFSQGSRYQAAISTGPYKLFVPANFFIAE